jgi:hypothetical protein
MPPETAKRSVPPGGGDESDRSSCWRSYSLKSGRWTSRCERVGGMRAETSVRKR